MKKNKKIIIIILVISLVFLLIFILNHYTPYTSDDFSFLYDYKNTSLSEGIERIHTLSQIAHSMKNLYLYVNGRIIPHAILQFLLIFPKTLFNIINSLMFCFLGLLIYKFINLLDNKKDIKPLKLTIIYSLLFILIPSFGMSVLWPSGSLNYLWSVIFILLYFYYFIKTIKENNKNIKSFLLLFILSLIVCNTTENFAGTSFIFSIIMIIYDTLKNKRFNYKYIFIIIGNITGLYLLLSAASLNGGREVTDLFDLSKIFNSLKDIILMLNVYLSLYFFIFIVILKDIIINKKIDKTLCLLFTLSLISNAILLVSPYVAQRAFLLSIILLIICLIYSFDKIIYNKIIKNIITYFIIILSIYTYAFIAYKDVKISYDIYNNEVVNKIISEKNNGNTNIIVNNYYQTYSKYTIFNNKYVFLTPYKKHWINEWIAFYYGVNSVVSN